MIFRKLANRPTVFRFKPGYSRLFLKNNIYANFQFLIVFLDDWCPPWSVGPGPGVIAGAMELVRWIFVSFCDS